MCSAEVVLFSEALMRRPVGARPSGPAGVCRRLFAGDPENPGRIARELEGELRRQVAARWNFDFERGTPLPGRYQWVPVGVQKSEPAAVHEIRPLKKPATPKTKKSAGADLVNQHKITDFLSKKKRPLSDDVTSSHKLKLRRLSGDRAPTTAGAT